MGEEREGLRDGKEDRETREREEQPGVRLESPSAGLGPSLWFHVVPVGRPHRSGGCSWGTDAPGK